ncbi:MAG: hypothetical protein ACRDGM_04675 [bacterium]
MEHLVAVAVLGLVVVAVFNLLAVGALAAMLAQRQSQGTDLAQRLLEEVRAAGYEAALSRHRQFVDSTRYPGYEWQVDVTEREPQLKEVAATVYWTSRRERSVSFVTYLRGR